MSAEQFDLLLAKLDEIRDDICDAVRMSDSGGCDCLSKRDVIAPIVEALSMRAEVDT